MGYIFIYTSYIISENNNNITHYNEKKYFNNIINPFFEVPKLNL